MKRTKKIIYILFFIIICNFASTEERFPSPEFSRGYQIPGMEYPLVKDTLFVYFDIIILIIFLYGTVFFIFKRRSRHGIFFITFLSLLYFGFYKKGCICSVGSIQNVTLSLVNADYLLPFSALMFFLIPLLLALYYGRVFCGSVCPLGAIQELIIIKPLKIPPFLKNILTIIPFLYLGLAVFYASVTGDFIICRFDPFVGFFRLSASFHMTIAGILTLISGMFIARPYCRFLCPYSVLLGLCSLLSKKHLTITPDNCIQCRLCENSCPLDAIIKPATDEQVSIKTKKIRKIIFYIVLAPLIVFSFAFLLPSFTPFFLRNYSSTPLLSAVENQEANEKIDIIKQNDSVLVKEDSNLEPQLKKRNPLLEKKIRQGLFWLGLYLGIVLVIKFITIYQKRSNKDYAIDKFSCVSCGRCMEYCPVEEVNKNV